MVTEEGNVVPAKEDTSSEVTQEVVTPTPEERIKALEAELNDAKAQKAKAEDSYKGIQRTLNKTSEELKRQSDLRGDVESLNSKVKLLAALLAEKGNISEDNLDGIPQGRKQDLLKQIDAEEAQRKQQSLAKEYATRADELYNQAKELKVPKKDLWAVEDALRNGLPQRAMEIIQDFQEQNRSKETTTTNESDEERINKLAEKRAEELYQQRLNKKNLLKTDKVTQSGGGEEHIPTDIAEFNQWIRTIPQDVYEKKYAAKVNEMRRNDLFK